LQGTLIVNAIAVSYEEYEIATRISRYWAKYRWCTQLSPSRSRANVWAWQCIYFPTFKPIFSDPVLLGTMRHYARATNCLSTSVLRAVFDDQRWSVSQCGRQCALCITLRLPLTAALSECWGFVGSPSHFR